MKQNDKYLAEGLDILNREFGQPLPTLEDTMKAHRLKKEGGPGSGKSYVAQGLFGIPEKAGITSMYGLKVVNTDAEFEHNLRKFGFETHGSDKLELDKWPPEVWDMVGGDQSPEDAKKNTIL